MGEFPVSKFQERLYFLQKLNPKSTTSNIENIHVLKGKLDEKILAQSIQRVLRQYEIFRTFFKETDHGVFQVVVPLQEIKTSIQIEDLTHLPENLKLQQALEKCKRIWSKAIDLGALPLCHFHIFKLEKDRFLLLEVIHHIIYDFVTAQRFKSEVLDTYGYMIRNETVVFKRPDSKYSDYAKDETTILPVEALEKHLSYWQTKLNEAPELVHLPTDYPRPPVIGSNYEMLNLELPTGVWSKLKEFAKTEHASMSMLSAATLFVFLHRYSGDNDICIGSPISTRSTPALQDVMGPMINTFVLRSKFDPGLSFRDFLAQIRAVAKEAYMNATVPFEQIISRIKPSRNISYSPLFQVMFDVVNLDSSLDKSFCEVRAISGFSGTQDMDLSVRFVDNNGLASLSFEYNTDLFKSSTIVRWQKSLATILLSIAENPDLQVGKIPLVTETERAQILKDSSGDIRTFEKNNGIHELFERQVASSPSKTALAYEGVNLSYFDLNQRANQLAHFLRGNGVRPNVFVGILMERSIEMFISILAILKAGGAYVPLDPEHPQERLLFVVNEIDAQVILTQNILITRLSSVPNNQIKTVCVDRDWQSIIQDSEKTDLICLNSPNDAAYMIYTSGSTGAPKGCVNTHQGLVNCLLSERELFKLGPNDRILQKTPYTFDASIDEILCPLVSGSTLVIAKPDGHKDTGYLIQTIQEQSITFVQFVPSMLQVFLEVEGLSRCRTLRIVMAGGEALPLETMKRFYQLLPEVSLLNSYGPTETAIACSYSKLEITDSAITIGKPLPNCQIYILDPQGEPVPVGVLGEIHVGGVQVAREYWKRPDLNKSRFLADPFSSLKHARIYKTGDSGRLLSDGRFDFQGRIDFQVKIRGFRVELGEIEAVLLSFPGVEQATVLLKKFAGNDSPELLVGYLVQRKNKRSLAELQDYLRQKLPEYMIPMHFVELESMPLNSNGKLDRKILLERKEVFTEASEVFKPPLDDIERALASAWESVLKVKPIGRTQKYFSLGGNSLSLIIILQKLRGYHFALELKDLYRYQTIAELGEVIRSRRTSGDPGLRTIDLNYAKLPSKILKSLEKEVIDAYPITGMQEFMISSYGGPSSIYHSVGGYQISLDGFSIPIFLESLNIQLDRHPAFSTFFVRHESNTFQTVRRNFSTPVEIVNIENLSVKQQTATIDRYYESDKGNLFDISQTDSPPWRLRIFYLNSSGIHLVISMHHALGDGWGSASFINEWITTYLKLHQGIPVKRPSLDWTFKEFVALEREAIVLGDQEFFWRNHLSNVRIPHLAKLENPEASIPQQTSVSELSKKLVDTLRERAQNQNVSLKSVFLTVSNRVLRRHLEIGILGIACVSNGRSERLTNPLTATGLYWNFLPYTDTSPLEQKIVDSIRFTHEELVKLEAHSSLPYPVILKLNQTLKNIQVSFNFIDIDQTQSESFNPIEGDYPIKVSRSVRSHSRNYDQFSFPINISITLLKDSHSVFRVNYSELIISKEKMQELMVQFQLELENTVLNA